MQELIVCVRTLDHGPLQGCRPKCLGGELCIKKRERRREKEKEKGKRKGKRKKKRLGDSLLASRSPCP